MHDDRTTLSRAIAQNKQLKEQLIELQDGFVKMVANDVPRATKKMHFVHLPFASSRTIT
jgi:hypothetical protein